MSSRIKEEERIERIIRGLLRLPENRRCINCQSLGPQYVCTTFCTFVCTNCSGIHREFTHRVKSVSMAKFNAVDVTALQVAGNERARQIYFKTWDPQRDSFPDGSNHHRLRDFIKHVYVDRKYTGERGPDKLAMVKPGVKDDFYEQCSLEKSSNGAKDDILYRHSFEKYSSSGNDDRNSRYYGEEISHPPEREQNVRAGGHRSRPARFEIVDDRFKDDEYGSGRRSEHRRYSISEYRAQSRSPNSRSSTETTSPLAVRPLKSILGEKVMALKVAEVSKTNDGKDAGGSACAQGTVSPIASGTVDEKAVEQKAMTISSLIDFSTDPEPPDTAAAPQTQQPAPFIDLGDSSLQSTRTEKNPNGPNETSMDYLLFELSSPAPVNMPEESVTSSALAFPVGNTQTLQSHCGDPLPTTGSSASAEALLNQPWGSPTVSNAQGLNPSASSEQSSQAASEPAQDTAPQDASKSSGRKELPADLFTSSYASLPTAVPSWQYSQPHVMGYGMQYHPAAMVSQPIPACSNSTKSTNPFDLSDVQAPMFSSMSSLQLALPNIAAPNPSPYASAHPPHSPSYGIELSPVAYMGRQSPTNMPVYRPQGIISPSSSEASFASLKPLHQSSTINTTPNAPNSSGGNPFD